MADRSWRRRQIREAESRYGPDQSEILYEFHDGWTIRRPILVSDCWREGFLQHNCLEKQDYGGAPGHYLVGEADWTRRDDSTVPLPIRVSRAFSPDFALSTTYVHSLRDPDNFPHVTFGHNPQEAKTCHAFGHGTTAPKAEYLDRLEVWHLTLNYPVEYEVHIVSNDPDPTCPAIRGEGPCPEADAVGARAA